MNPLVIAGGVVLFILATSKGGLSNVFNPANLFTTAPGPGAQAGRRGGRAGAAGIGGPPNYQQGTGTGSPNSTLATVDNILIVANNALGQIDKLGSDYFPSSNDSEYPVSPSGSAGSVNTPTSYAPPDTTEWGFDPAVYTADQQIDTSYLA